MYHHIPMITYYLLPITRQGLVPRRLVAPGRARGALPRGRSPAEFHAVEKGMPHIVLQRCMNCVHFSMCARHPYAGAMLIFSVSLQC